MEVFITILAFFLGLISTMIISKWEEGKRMKRLKSFYLSWIGFSLESFDRQITLLENHISEIEQNGTGRINFNNNQIEKLNDINNEDLFDAFVIRNTGITNLNAENLHKLGSHVEYLVIALSNIKEKFYDFRNDEKEWSNEWNKSYLDFGKVIFEYVSTHKINMGKNVSEILEIKERLNEIDQNIPLLNQQILEIFVTPIRRVFSHHLNLSHDLIAMEGIKISETLNVLRLKKIKVNNIYIESMKDYCGQLKYTIKKSREILEFFKNQN